MAGGKLDFSEEDLVVENIAFQVEFPNYYYYFFLNAITGHYKSIQVLLLTKSGKVFVWSQTNPVLTRYFKNLCVVTIAFTVFDAPPQYSFRCTFRGSPFCVMKDIALFKNSLAFVNREGEAFVGTIGNTSPGKRKVESQCTIEQISTRIEFPKREQFVQIHIQRIPGIYRATSIACDPTGKNFAVTQVCPSVH